MPKVIKQAPPADMLKKYHTTTLAFFQEKLERRFVTSIWIANAVVYFYKEFLIAVCVPKDKILTVLDLSTLDLLKDENYHSYVSEIKKEDIEACVNDQAYDDIIYTEVSFYELFRQASRIVGEEITALWLAVADGNTES